MKRSRAASGTARKRLKRSHGIPVHGEKEKTPSGQVFDQTDLPSSDIEPDDLASDDEDSDSSDLPLPLASNFSKFKALLLTQLDDANQPEVSTLAHTYIQ